MPLWATSDTYWDIDGTSLSQVCWMVKTLGDGRSSVPKFRGEDTVMAYRPGARHEEKGIDSRILPLQMWVNDSEISGGAVTYRDQEYEKNLRTLRSLFWKDDGAEFTITKRWREGGTVKSASGLGSLASDFAPAMIGPYAGSVGVDVYMANPWFYEPLVTTTLVKDTPQVVNNTGDARTNGYDGTIELIGPLTNPKITNGTIWVQVGLAIATGDKVTLDLWNWTATRDSDDGNVIGAVIHSGARQWLPLAKGANTLELTATSGTGTAVFKHRAPRF